jgi:hypothetical protein
VGEQSNGADSGVKAGRRFLWEGRDKAEGPGRCWSPRAQWPAVSCPNPTSPNVTVSLSPCKIGKFHVSTGSTRQSQSLALAGRDFSGWKGQQRPEGMRFGGLTEKTWRVLIVSFFCGAGEQMHVSGLFPSPCSPKPGIFSVLRNQKLQRTPFSFNQI